MITRCFLSLLLLAIVDSLRCYVCDSARGIDCSGQMKIRDCVLNMRSTNHPDFKPNTCVKIVARNVKGDEFVAKNCVCSTQVGMIRCSILAKLIGFRVPGVDPKTMKCHLCQGRLCNNANDPDPVAFPVFAVWILYLVLER